MSYYLITGQRKSIYDSLRGFGFQDVIPWGKSNLYPQIFKDVISKSGYADAIRGRYADFLTGSGFDSYDDYIGKHKLGVLWERAINDFSYLNTWVLHVNFNLQGKITDFNYLPAEYCRLVRPEENEYEPTKIKVFDNWGGIYFFGGKEGVDISIYDGDIDRVKFEIRKEGIQNYKGQIYMFSPYDEPDYQNSPFHPEFESIEADVEMKLFTNSNVRNNFLPAQVFVKIGRFGEGEKKEWEEKLNSAQGGSNGGKTLMVEAPTAEEIPQVMSGFQPKNLDGIFEKSQDSVKERLRTLIGMHPILLGWKGQNNLAPNAQEIEEATELFRGSVAKTIERNKEKFNNLLENSIFSSRIEDIEPFRLIKDGADNNNQRPSEFGPNQSESSESSEDQ